MSIVGDKSRFLCDLAHAMLAVGLVGKVTSGPEFFLHLRPSDSKILGEHKIDYSRPSFYDK